MPSCATSYGDKGRRCAGSRISHRARNTMRLTPCYDICQRKLLFCVVLWNVVTPPPPHPPYFGTRTMASRAVPFHCYLNRHDFEPCHWGAADTPRRVRIGRGLRFRQRRLPETVTHAANRLDEFAVRSKFA